MQQGQQLVCNRVRAPARHCGPQSQGAFIPKTYCASREPEETQDSRRGLKDTGAQGPWTEGTHLFDKVPGIRGEVGGQRQLPFDDLVHRLLPVLCREGRLEKAGVRGDLRASPQALAQPRDGEPLPPPSPTTPRRLDLPSR